MAQVNPIQIPTSPVNGVMAPVSGGLGQYPATSLYVGDLDLNVTDAQLFDMFSQVGPVVSVRVCRDLTNRQSLGYGYVNYSSPVDAARALDDLNFSPLNGKPIRVMYSNRDPSTRKSGAGNIFIKNLDKSIDHKALHDTFSVFGNIMSCKVATDSSERSKGYGFVQFEQDESAQNAIDKLNGMCLNDKVVYVGRFLRKQERENDPSKQKFNNVFVKNLSETTTKEELDKIFGEFGTITSSVVMTEGDGKSKCFGFINFENTDSAARAVQELNGKKIGDKEWYVGKAQKKAEREKELKGKFDQSAKKAAEKYQGVNLYLKNIDDSFGDDNLRDLFSQYGTITSCKIMRDLNGISRGSGFVAFSSPESASHALAEMNGKMIGGKPLYVAFAQRKEERKARLQAQFSQLRPVSISPNATPRMPMYPPGAPGINQQVFYGQPPSALVPPQPGFGYQQQLVPGVRPGGAAMPNYYVPMVQQGQQPQRPAGRRALNGQFQQHQHPVPMHQQIRGGGRGYRYLPGRNMGNIPMPGGMAAPGGMVPVPYQVGGVPIRDATAVPQPIPVSALTSALANATPEQQRTMLGESLYPLVDQLEHESAAKVTGMLLEMDQTEVLHLLESPDALKEKVAEAIEVLRTVQQQQQQQQAGAASPAHQLASLSLSDGIVS